MCYLTINIQEFTMADNKVQPLDTGPESTREPTKVEAGLSENVAQLIESPEQMMARVLMPGELVRSEFECYFPSKFVPRWKIIMLLTITCGLYGFVLLFRAIERWCYKAKCCTPRIVSFTRGKLAITSKGRIICWNEYVSQVKEKGKDSNCIAKCLCPELSRPPLTYTTEMKTAVFSATKIRQISEIYTSSALCCCCCVDYDCMVEVSFENFRPSKDNFVTVRSKWDFYGMIQSILNTGLSAIEGSMGVSSNNANVLYIVSGTQDVVHNGDIHSVVEELTHLYCNIIQALPTKALPDVFVSQGGDVESAQPAVVDKLKGVTIVADDLKVTIPAQWLSILPGEQVICSYGEMFQMRSVEWLATLLSLGLLYCIDYRNRKYLRYGVVLTTKRIIVLDIFQRSGRY